MDRTPLHILLVEDDPDDFLLTSELLKEIPGGKITVDWAKTFADGREKLRPCSHDVVLVDYRLGKGDGISLMRKAQDEGCKAPIILLTGQGDRELALQALKAGAADYLIKGEIDAMTLERSIRYALVQKTHATELEDKVAARTSELEEANAALRESEKQIRALLDATETARVSAEAAKARAEAATRAKDDFLAALSHELRTPLNPALLLATSLSQNIDLPPQIRSDIDVIAKGIALQAQLVDDLLDITRITGGKLRLNLQPIDAHAAMQQVYHILRADIDEREIEVTLQFDAAQYMIKADAVRVQQIFWNVLKNAVKFTPPGGNVTVRTRNASATFLEVEVADTGVGISKEMLGHVFDAFIQEEHEVGHRFGGLGLGLAISQRLVQLQEGRIRAESAGRGKGSVFRIEFPLATPSEQARAATLPSPRQEQSPVPARRILLVEDHEQTRETLTRLLEKRGHVVINAGHAGAARECAATGDFDLVISDLGLPDCDGNILMAELRDLYSIPGIALSGYGMEEDVERSRASGFFTHLTKPVDIRVLESAIADAPLLDSAKRAG